MCRIDISLWHFITQRLKDNKVRSYAARVKVKQIPCFCNKVKDHHQLPHLDGFIDLDIYVTINVERLICIRIPEAWRLLLKKNLVVVLVFLLAVATLLMQSCVCGVAPTG